MSSSDPYVKDVKVDDISSGVEVGKKLPTPGICTIYRGLYTPSNGKTVDVAIKRIRSVGKGDQSSRNHELRKEVSVLRAARHHNIVPYYGTMTYKGDVCIVTQLAEPGSLHDYLQEHDLDANRRDILFQVASGLHYLHTPTPEKGVIVHGDLHIDNILMSTEGYPMICDFGLCKVIPDGQLASLSVQRDQRPGVAAYIAPELHQLQPHYLRSTNTDVFSFGILIFHLYAGSAPFSTVGSRGAGVIVNLAQGKRPSRADIKREDFTDELWELVCKCWAQVDDKPRPTMEEVLRSFP